MEALVSHRTDAAAQRYKASRVEHWDRLTRDLGRRRGWGHAYHRRLAAVYRSLIPPGRRVLEVGCGHGDLLAALRPSVGVGIDFSAEAVARAEAAHPDLTFLHAD